MNEKCKGCNYNATCICSVALTNDEISEIRKKDGYMCHMHNISAAKKNGTVVCSHHESIKEYEYTSYKVIDRIGTKDSKYLPFSVFIIADDIRTESEKRQFDMFVKKIRSETHTVIVDPIRYFNDHPFITNDSKLAKNIDIHDTEIYKDIFDSLATSCEAIYYIKLDYDNEKIDDIKDRLYSMYQDYVREGYHNINKISIYTNINELPFD